MRLVSDEPDLPGGTGEQRELLRRPRAVVETKDSENAELRRCWTGNVGLMTLVDGERGCWGR